jgi:hypothetical protein
MTVANDNIAQQQRTQLRNIANILCICTTLVRRMGETRDGWKRMQAAWEGLCQQTQQHATQ